MADATLKTQKDYKCLLDAASCILKVFKHVAISGEQCEAEACDSAVPVYHWLSPARTGLAPRSACLFANGELSHQSSAHGCIHHLRRDVSSPENLSEMRT